MKRKAVVTLAIGLGLAATLGLLAGLALAQGGGPVTPQADTAPPLVSYQGQVQVNGQPYSGTGYFKFAIVNLGGSNVWTNDGSNLGTAITPTNAVALTVEDGIFAVLLGNVTLPNMTSLSADVFSGSGRWLHVWFDEDGGGAFTDLGTTRIAAVPYALNAELLDGLDGSDFQQRYDHVVVVAKSGGDYTTVNEALASITDNGEYSRYLLWVGPGVYSETVQMKPYVSIQGAGSGTTVLLSMVSSSSTYPPAATVVVTENVTLRDVTVVVTGTGDYKAAILVRDVETDTAGIADVVAQAGGGSNTYGIYDYYAAPIIRDTKVESEGSSAGYGIYNYYSSPTLRDLIVSGKGNSWGYGICNKYSSPTIRYTTASGEGGLGGYGYGIYNSHSSPTIQNSIASGEAGVFGNGIRNETGGSYTVIVDSCQLTGSSKAIANTANWTVNVGASLLDGGADTDGTYNCVGAYDGSYSALDASCQ